MATSSKDFKVRYGLTVGNKINAVVPTTSYASLNLPHGNAPSAPVNGDMWTTSAGLYARINGVTVGPFGAGGGASVTISDTAPVSPTAGSLWFKSSTGVTYIYYDSFWIQMNPGGMPNPLTTTGDTLYSSSGSTPARLGIGTAGQAYTVNAGATAPQWSTLTLENLPGAWAKRSVKAATTGSNITLSAGAPNTLDGVTLALNDRILVKDQTAPAQNGIYYVSTLGTGANGTWTRTLDADAIDEIASAVVAVDQGTVNGGLAFDNDTKTTDTLGTTAIVWNRIVDVGYSMNIGTTAVPLGRASAALTLAGITLTAPTFTGTMTTSLTTAGYVTTTAGGVLSSVATIPNAGLTNSSVTIGTTAIALGASSTTLAGLTSVNVGGTVTATTFSGSGASLTSIPNTALTNSSVTVGTTAIALGASSTTLAGLTSVTATTFTGALSGNATSATNATNTGITEDVATAVAVYPTWVTANTGNLPQKTTSTKLSFVPSTGVLTSTQVNASKMVLSGAQTLAEYRVRNFYVSTTDPGTGNDGDIWLKY